MQRHLCEYIHDCAVQGKGHHRQHYVALWAICRCQHEMVLNSERKIGLFLKRITAGRAGHALSTLRL